MSTIRTFALALVATAALLPAAVTDALAARILLTNDDGYDAPGLTTLKTALEKAGHDVTVVAPSGNRSGSSAAITTTAFAVTRISEDVWSVDGTPATSMLYGATVVMKDTPPDLVISGTNAGANVGPLTVASGTVGNTVMAITQFAVPYPAVAFSTDPVDADPVSAANIKHYEEVADFGVRLVARVLRNLDKLEARGRFAINVNWPGVTKDKIKGVRHTVQGRKLQFGWGFREVAPGLWAISPGAPPKVKDVSNSDIVNHEKNYVTITVLDGNYTAPGKMRESVYWAVGTPKP